MVRGFDLLGGSSTGRIVRKISKLNIVAPYELRITLNEALQLNEITTTPIEFLSGDTGIVRYDLGFNNGDENDFLPNPNVIFDGQLKLRNDYSSPMVKDTTWTEEGELNRSLITRSQFQRINTVNILNN